jgi:hypothetical protein
VHSTGAPLSRSQPVRPRRRRRRDVAPLLCQAPGALARRRPMALRHDRGNASKARCTPGGDTRPIALIGDSPRQSASPCETSTPLLEGDEQRRIAEAHHAERLEQRVADRKSRLPAMKATRALRPLRPARGAARLEVALGDVVADPDLEQVAEDEDGVGAVCRRCAAQASKAPGVLASRCRSLMKSTARQSPGRRGWASPRGGAAPGPGRAARPRPQGSSTPRSASGHDRWRG